MIGFIIVVAVISISILIVGVLIYKERYYKLKTGVSFGEALDLVGIPIITLDNNGNKFNFLLDTGSSACSINSSVLNSLSFKMTEFTDSLYGVDGNIIDTPICLIDFTHRNNNKWTIPFRIMDMDKTFGNLEEDCKIKVHGILGSDFLKDNKYILDYVEMTAYHK